MATLETLVKELPLTFDRSTLYGQLASAMAFIDEVVLPYIVASEEFANISKEYKSKEANSILSQFYALSNSRKKDFQSDLIVTLTAITRSIPKVLKDISKTFPRTVTRDTLTYRQLAYIQYGAGCDFIATFIPKLLTYVVRLEIASLTKGRIEDEMSKAAILDVKEGNIPFSCLISEMGWEADQMVAKLANTADIVIDADNIPVMVSTHGAAKLAPFVRGFIPTKYNPFRIIGMALAEYHAKRYHQLQEQLSLFQVLLAYQRQLLQKEVDPAVERRIEELTIIVETLQAKLRDMEKRYA